MLPPSSEKIPSASNRHQIKLNRLLHPSLRIPSDIPSHRRILLHLPHAREAVVPEVPVHPILINRIDHKLINRALGSPGTVTRELDDGHNHEREEKVREGDQMRHFLWVGAGKGGLESVSVQLGDEGEGEGWSCGGGGEVSRPR
jgi:hypothetical protein